MNKLFVLLLFVFPMILPSCKDEESSIDGDCTEERKFERDKVEFTDKGGTTKIKALNDWWWIESYMQVDGKQVFLYDTPGFEIETGKIKGWDNPNVIYDEGADMEIKKISAPWFTITKDTYSSLTIDTDPNDTGKSRSLVLGVQAGNCFYSVQVIQSAD